MLVQQDGGADASFIDREVREEHRTKVLARTKDLERDPAQVQVDPHGRDGPTVEQYARHHDGIQKVKTGEIDSRQGTSLAFRFTNHSPAETLWRRGALLDSQYAAACRYREIHHLAHLEAKVVADYGQSTGFGGGDPGAWLYAPSEAIAQRRKVLAEARAAIGSQLVVECVDAFVIHERSLFDIGYWINSSWKPSTATLRGGEKVRAGLNALARHFGVDQGSKG